jgi:predicted TIM-barrel fold metal-dependent hydrolase
MIIDGHVHIGTDAPFSRPENIVKELTKHKIDKAVVMSPNAAINNEWVSNQIKKFNKYFIAGFACINPKDGDKAVEELEKAIKVWGLNVLKLDPYTHGYAPNTKIVDSLMEKASNLKIPVEIHSGHAPHSTPWQIAECAEKYSDVPIIMAHMGGETYVDDAIKLAKKIDNIILDISVQPYIVKIKEAVDVIGAERIVYGSGAPYVHHIIPLMNVKLAGLTEEQENLILAKNIIRLLNLQL